MTLDGHSKSYLLIINWSNESAVKFGFSDLLSICFFLKGELSIAIYEKKGYILNL